jgi:hypothetical protein
MPALTVGRPPNAPITFYPDHPPLVPLLIVPFYKTFGFGEWQTRLATSIVNVAAIFCALGNAGAICQSTERSYFGCDLCRSTSAASPK